MFRQIVRVKVARNDGCFVLVWVSTVFEFFKLLLEREIVVELLVHFLSI